MRREQHQSSIVVPASGQATASTAHRCGRRACNTSELFDLFGSVRLGRAHSSPQPGPGTRAGASLRPTANVCNSLVMADSRVSAAISHWAPRFVANGIDYSDFVKVTSGIPVWDDWCARWCEEGAKHEELG